MISLFRSLWFPLAAGSLYPLAAEPLDRGITLAWVVMATLAASLLYAAAASLGAVKGVVSQRVARLDFAVPYLCLAGLGVAGYLTYVEAFNVAAICGPVGDCNTVQSSPYAKLFGVLPVGLLGMAGFVGILAVWIAGRRAAGRVAQIAPLLVFALALFGVLFSIYLTYLEIFIIEAVCAWCLSSAILISLLLLLSVPPAVAALEGDLEEDQDDAARQRGL